MASMYLPPPHRRLHLPVLALVFLGTGCATLLPHQAGRPRPYPRRQIQAYLDTARHPSAFGIRSTRAGAVAANDLFLTSFAERIEVPMLTEAGSPQHPVVAMSINGHEVLAVVDTGAHTTLIDLPTARKAGVVPLGIPPRILPALGFGGQTEQILSIAESVRVGDLTARNVPLGVLNDRQGLSMLASVEGLGAQALLGYDLLARFSWVQFNWTTQTVTFSTDQPFQPPRRPRPVGFDMVARPDRRATIQARIEPGGDVEASLDTGGNFAIWLPPALARELGYDPDAPGLPVIPKSSISGRKSSVRTGPANLVAGRIQAHGLPVDVSTLRLEALESIGPLLGTRFLSRFILTLDFTNGKVWLAPAPGSPPPPPPDSAP